MSTKMEKMFIPVVVVLLLVSSYAVFQASSVPALQNEIASLKSSAATNSDVSGIQIKTDSQASRILAAENDVKNIRAMIESEVKGIKNSLNGIKTSVDAQNSKLPAIEGELTRTKISVDGLISASVPKTPKGFLTNDQPYVRPAHAGVTVVPLLTVGETVPLTSDNSKQYRMVGIPDGMGAYDAGDGTLRLYLNHEFGSTIVSQPIVGGSAMKGAFVSKYVISKTDYSIISGDLAYRNIYKGTDSTPITGSFARFCSGYLAGPHVGFDRYIYLTGEESEGQATFDGRGGQPIAIIDGSAYLLPDFGRFAYENLVVVPGTGQLTVVIGLEDGPSTLDSQLYMYVGMKNPTATDPLNKNGLVGGKFYVLKSMTPKKVDEATFHKGEGRINATWVEIPNAGRMTDAELNKYANDVGSFNFVRIEDGAYDKTKAGVFYFDTTGSNLKLNDQDVNRRGRLYKLTFDVRDPTKLSTLEVLLEGDKGDPIVNPDNLDTSADGIIMIQEDPNGDSRGSFLGGRDSSIWAYDIGSGILRRVAELNQLVVPSDLRNVAGFWESSGIIDMSSIFGSGTWMINVQAHSITSSEASKLQNLSTDAQVVAGGQLLLLKIQIK